LDADEDRELLRKLANAIKLLDSDNDGEVLNAAAGIKRLLAAHGRAMHDLAAIVESGVADAGYQRWLADERREKEARQRELARKQRVESVMGKLYAWLNQRSEDLLPHEATILGLLSRMPESDWLAGWKEGDLEQAERIFAVAGKPRKDRLDGERAIKKEMEAKLQGHRSLGMRGANGRTAG
jgi:hypothetical protein